MCQPCRLFFHRPAAGPFGAEKIPVHPGNDVDLDPLGADRFAFAHVGAASEQLGIGLRHHGHHALVALRLALWQQPQVRDFGAHE